ncbi:Uncharacterized protein DBV15_07535 [Temnothorax longispinosus]|uniref:Uncharacterized protein n=1 Tax=Temnothorax longispinosus TaxID=300112 RepID=A0A4V3S892_9HYME|nr:Uncharacterized protein DBV15_07535 [Temnothorax longispinosus]
MNYLFHTELAQPHQPMGESAADQFYANALRFLPSEETTLGEVGSVMSLTGGSCRLSVCASNTLNSAPSPTARPPASTEKETRREMERSDRERRNGTAVKSEKAENRAVRDAVPEIYGSPDNEEGSSASAMAAFCVACPHILGARGPTWFCGE